MLKGLTALKTSTETKLTTIARAGGTIGRRYLHQKSAVHNQFIVPTLRILYLLTISGNKQMATNENAQMKHLLPCFDANMSNNQFRQGFESNFG